MYYYATQIYKKSQDWIEVGLFNQDFTDLYFFLKLSVNVNKFYISFKLLPTMVIITFSLQSGTNIIFEWNNYCTPVTGWNYKNLINR